MELKDLVGKKIKNAFYNKDYEFIFLECETENYKLIPSGDCCTICFIQHIDGSEVLENAIIKEIENLEYIEDIHSNTDNYEVIDTFGHRIHTDKGICTIELRAEHNGFYYGYLTVIQEDNEKKSTEKLTDF